MDPRFQFKPKLIPTLATLILLPILISLGFWQVDRADQKRQIMSDYSSRATLQPLNINALDYIQDTAQSSVRYNAQNNTQDQSQNKIQSNAQNNTQEKSLNDINFYPITVTGQYDNQHNILLDNKIYHHQIGYQVLTPLQLNNHKYILINRGWIPQGTTRDQLPTIKPVYGPQTIRGILRTTPDKSFTLGENNKITTWPWLVEKLDFKQISQETGYSIYPVIIQLANNQPNGFARDWTPVYGDPQRNISYAIQWFGLALTLIIIYISVNLQLIKE